MPDIDAFIDRWKAAGGTELANYQLFLTELAVLLDLPRPEPATGDARTDAYVFASPDALALGVLSSLVPATSVGHSRPVPHWRTDPFT